MKAHCVHSEHECKLQGRVGNSITWDELVTFSGRNGYCLTHQAK